MANNRLTLGAVVSNTNPALFPGPEPLICQHVTPENHFPDLCENAGSHDDLWAWVAAGPFSTTSDFLHLLNPHLEMSDDLVVYTVLLLSGQSKGKAVGLASLFGAHLDNRVIELGGFFGPQL